MLNRKPTSGLLFSVTMDLELSGMYSVGRFRRLARYSGSCSTCSRSASYHGPPKRFGGLICEPRPFASGWSMTLLSGSRQDQASVAAAEAEGVGYCHAHGLRARLVGNVAEIAIRVGV